MTTDMELFDLIDELREVVLCLLGGLEDLNNALIGRQEELIRRKSWRENLKQLAESADTLKNAAEDTSMER
jgi:hypothetical protein